MKGTVLKRDGKVVNFDINKVIAAVMAAQASVDRSDFYQAFDVARKIQEEVFSREETVSIAEVQDSVESLLMQVEPQIAQKYIAYRSKRDAIRESNSKLVKDLNDLISKTNDDMIKENANKDAKVFPVQRDMMAGIVSKHLARNILPEDVMSAHLSGDIHYHDLDYSPFLPMTNCCLVDLKGLLENGFKLGSAQIESPRSFGVACAVTAQIIAQVASHQYGGTTIANIDQVLAPYAEISWTKHWTRAQDWEIADPDAYADSMTSKEIYDGVQAMEYEINTLFTTNGQQPFVTFSFGMGKSWYCREIQKAILQVRIKGLGKDGITAVFPKLVMFLEEGLNVKKEDPNYDIKQLALECAAKRLYPDIISAKINREITGSSVPVSPMGCRSFLSVWKDESGAEVLDGRNNLGVVSLNIPRIAIESGGDFTKFNAIMRERLDLCFKALMTRIDRLKGVKAEVAPIMYTEGALGVRLKPEDEVLDIFRNGRASVSLGYIGLHEAALIMFGEHPFDNKDAQAFLKGVVRDLRMTVDGWKKETGWGFSLYSTPSESLCNRFCKLDKAAFGEIAGVTDKGWYTNSFHLDVDRKATPFQKIEYECEYHYLASGGHISYAEFPNMKNNLEGLEAVWDYAIQHLAYFGTNTPADNCLKCGFEGEATCTNDGFSCPSCGNTDQGSMSVVRRTCGYLGQCAARPFNEGKQKEMVHRVKHVEAKV